MATLLSPLAIFATFIDEQTTQRVANRVVVRTTILDPDRPPT